MVEIDGIKYNVIKDYREALDIEDLKGKITDYYDSFEYILGDYAYGKVRLKGFNKKGSKNYKKINDYNLIDDYINKYCAYGCKYFILQRVKV